MSNIDINNVLKEAKFKFSRSRGKGGQNVNKVETKAEMIFNIEASKVLNHEAIEILVRKFAARLDGEGNLRIVNQTERSQFGNRKKAIQKFVKLITKALQKEKVRVRTQRTFQSQIKRLDEKKKKSSKKKDRTVRYFQDE